MERSEKKLAELGKVLNGGKKRDIEARISLLRSEPPFKGALKLVALYYDSTDDENIKISISGLFNDLKEKSARDEVIETIASVSRPGSKTMLVSSCWQSGLDYSRYAGPLAGFFMTGDYMTSLECFTVFETCSAEISDSDRTGIIFSLQQQIESWDTPKQKLARELIALLKG
jgi:hypothetical protein